MKNNRLLQGFIATLIIAILLRFFVIDVISVSNNLLKPDFYPGDFLLISKVSSVEEGQWALLKNYPQKGVYSVRRLLKKESDQGWIVAEPSPMDSYREEKAFVSGTQVAGKAVMILWSLPCKPSAAADGSCSDKPYRYLKTI